MRPLEIVPGFLKNAHGSVLVSFGNTKVVCSAMIVDGVPPHAKASGTGWLTAEYDMLPGSTLDRTSRDRNKGQINGRSSEIQRLIGRSIRAAIDYRAIGERTLWLDCDVLQADGGTRTAALTGAFPAAVLALAELRSRGKLAALPVLDSVAAISVGIVDGEAMVDLNYEEDRRAEVDMNVVMSGGGKFIEVQGTAEREPFDREQLDAMLALAAEAISAITEKQLAVLKGVWRPG